MSRRAGGVMSGGGFDVGLLPRPIFVNGFPLCSFRWPLSARQSNGGNASTSASPPRSRPSGPCGDCRAARAALASILAVVVALILGGSNPFSLALWRHFPPLRFVRYPGNMSYLALLPLAALVGAGLARTRRAPLLAAAIAAELLVCGWRATPTAPRSLFTAAGPLVRALQERLDGTRYLISPRALEASRGANAEDWKTRLYGLTNAPYRLRAVANFGEPLVPAPNYAVMDRLLGARSAAEAASWLPWLGASRLLTPDPPSTPLLIPEKRTLWNVSRAAAPVALAYRLSEAAGAALPEDLPAAPPAPGVPLAGFSRARGPLLGFRARARAGRLSQSRATPGWRATLETPAGARRSRRGPRSARSRKSPCPTARGPCVSSTIPSSWRLGVLISLAALLAFGSYWYHRTSLPSHVA